MLCSEADETANNLARSQTTIPDAIPERCLGLNIPLRGDHNQSRSNDSLAYAQQGADSYN